MMNTVLTIVGITMPVIITVLITGLRVERRLTKVETNLMWVMKYIRVNGCRKEGDKDKECET